MESNVQPNMCKEMGLLQKIINEKVSKTFYWLVIISPKASPTLPLPTR